MSKRGHWSRERMSRRVEMLWRIYILVMFASCAAMLVFTVIEIGNK